MLLLFSIRIAVWKELFIQFSVHELLSICVCCSFPFGFEGGISDWIMFIPYHCLSIYFYNVSITGSDARSNCM